MFVKLSITGQVTLEDRDQQLPRLQDRGRGRPTAASIQVKRALANIAEIEDQTHAWIFEQGLRQRPEVAGDATWQGNLGAMMEKAKPHGWIDEQKKAIKAHIEWTASA